MEDLDALARALTLQGDLCGAFGSPFSREVLRRGARDILDEGPTLSQFAPWRGLETPTLLSRAVGLRWLGALHDLVLSGDAPALAAHYPTGNGAVDPDGAWARIVEAMATHRARIAGFMAHEPQTNEVGRAACLTPGFLVVARETRLPLCCFEIGASAGLNQIWDRYAYDFAGAGVWGPADSPVTIRTEWRGPPPPLNVDARVISRAACDRNPVVIADPAARRRLRAYVWAGQAERLARLEGAMSMALAGDIVVTAEDAASWAARVAAPTRGAATVLYHSIFWQYMSAEGAAAMLATIEALAARATPEAPFAWLRMEPPLTRLAATELRLTLWPGGEERLLATVHPHGAWMDWAA